MLEVITALGIWAVLLPTIYGLGHFSVSRTLKVDSFLMRGIFFISFGLGILGYFIIILGTSKILRVEIVWSGILIFFLMSIRTWGEFLRWGKDLFTYLFLKPTTTFGDLTRLIFLVSIVISLISSFVPEIANDSLAYHLNLPKIFINHASTLPLPYDEKSYRSLLMEGLFTIPMFLKNIPATIFFHWATTFLLVTALIVWIEAESRNYAWALFMGVLLWLTPTIFNQVAISHTDGSVALFAFLAFYLIQQGWQNQKNRSDFFIGGLLIGLSISAKYLTLMFGSAVGVALTYVFCLKKTNKKFIFQGMLLLGAGAFLMAAYWFTRNYILTGDLLYPFFTDRFGSAGLYAEQKFSQIGVPKNILSFLTLPYSIVAFPDLFDRHHWVGPAYFFVMPAALFSLRWPKFRPMVITVILSTLIWFLSAQNIRFLFSSFPLWIGLAGLTFASVIDRFSARWRRVSEFVAVVGLCGYLALGFYHYRVQLVAVIQHWSTDVFLTRMERSYPAAVWANQNLPRHAKVLNAMEVRSYYFNVEMIDGPMFYRVHYQFKGAAPDVTVDLLRKQGITHVMRCEWLGNNFEQKSKNSFQFLDRALENQKVFKKLVSMESENIREDRYRYTFYELLN